MKKLLFIFLIISGIKPVIAEDIRNIDTPVNWSYYALFNTIWDLYNEEPTTYSAGYYIAEKLYYAYAEANQAVSARWICEKYIYFAQEEGLTAYNCYDVITKMIDNHNKDIKFNRALKPIDKLQPDLPVFWSPVATTDACVKLADTYKELLIADNPIKVIASDARNFAVSESNSAFKRCRNIKYTHYLYSEPRSINELLQDCKQTVFQMIMGKTYDNLCLTWIDDAINYHNEHVRDIQNISGSIKQ